MITSRPPNNAYRAGYDLVFRPASQARLYSECLDDAKHEWVRPDNHNVRKCLNCGIVQPMGLVALKQREGMYPWIAPLMSSAEDGS